jgi:hypothetical protein
MEVTNLLMVLRFNMEYCFWDELFDEGESFGGVLAIDLNRNVVSGHRNQDAGRWKKKVREYIYTSTRPSDEER